MAAISLLSAVPTKSHSPITIRQDRNHPYGTGGNACIRSPWRVVVLIGHFNVNGQRLALHGLAAAIWKLRPIDQGTERTHGSLPVLIAINTRGRFHWILAVIIICVQYSCRSVYYLAHSPGTPFSDTVGAHCSELPQGVKLVHQPIDP